MEKMMTEVKVEAVDLPSLYLGEGPYWDGEQRALVVADVRGKQLWKYYEETGRKEVLRVDGGGPESWLSFAIPVEGEEHLWITGLGNTLALVSWPPSSSSSDTQTATPIILCAAEEYEINDAKCDPQGRLWTGTMSKLNDNLEPLHPDTCFLYKFDLDLKLTRWAKDVTLSNGMAWSKDRRHFFYADSYTASVYHFDYDDQLGAVSGQRVLIDFKAAGLGGVPDGMTIDVDDNLWVACFDGGKIVCVDSGSGKVLREVAVPAPRVTSVCWGGPGLDTLYATSGSFISSPEARGVGGAGGTFAIKGLNTRGFPQLPFKPDLQALREKMNM